VTIASRTPEGDGFACRVCGTVDRIEPSPLTGDAVCPNCGGYLARLLGDIESVFGHPTAPLSLDTELETIVGYDSFDVAEWVWKWEEEFGVRTNEDRIAECRTLADLIGYLISLRDPQ
jgi:acyl carrier protein